MKVHHEGDYRVARQLRYPPIEDLADALYHQSRGNDEPMERYLAKCEAVKKSCPKPAIPANDP
jgi:hypothetical protein